MVPLHFLLKKPSKVYAEQKPVIWGESKQSNSLWFSQRFFRWIVLNLSSLIYVEIIPGTHSSIELYLEVIYIIFLEW